MKAGPIVAMIALLAVGMWMVLQPTLSRTQYDVSFQVGAEEVLVALVDSGPDAAELDAGGPESEPESGASAGEDRTGHGGRVGVRTRYKIVSPARLATTDAIDSLELMSVVERESADWQARPAFERTLLGFLNITSWANFGWVAIGLAGQIAFFGRMMVQWVVSEKSRRSQVPELFWWFSFLGGLCLFTYFVWRVDIVGVLGQSTGVVIYARNLRLIYKQKRRERRDGHTAIGSSGNAGDRTADA